MPNRAGVVFYYSTLEGRFTASRFMVTQPRVLIVSLRNIFTTALFRGPHYEFEDIVSQIDAADILTPTTDLSNLHHRVAERVAFHFPLALNPGFRAIKVRSHYDLFLAVCGHPRDLLMVNAVSNWRETCKVSVCLIDELWVKEMEDHRYFLRILKKFDVIVLYYSQSVEPLSERIGRRCVFLPPGLDAFLFCPYPKPAKRVVDVYSIGRRSEITHRSLLKMAAESGLFYLHDSIAGDQAISLTEHRALFANVAKKSRYFIVNPGLIDRPDKRGNQIEIGNRYFEGAAAGAIMLGERPSTEQFDRLFDWPDAVVHVPYGSNNINRIINEMDRDPERVERIRRMNVLNSLIRHDWAYRWESILKTVGLEPMPGLLLRKQRLRRLAESCFPAEYYQTGFVA